MAKRMAMAVMSDPMPTEKTKSNNSNAADNLVQPAHNNENHAQQPQIPQVQHQVLAATSGVQQPHQLRFPFDPTGMY